jgi:hypothetical protein
MPPPAIPRTQPSFLPFEPLLMMVLMNTITNVEAHGYSFSIKNIWLSETGIRLFSKTGGCYKFSKRTGDERDVIIVKISEINPSIRGYGIPIFRGESSVLDIFRAFKNDIPLPPVEVEKINNGEYRFELKAGCHRLHLSIAVGFDSVPAVLKAQI